MSKAFIAAVLRDVHHPQDQGRQYRALQGQSGAEEGRVICQSVSSAGSKKEPESDRT
ncbi:MULTISPECIES: hypothetical protein [Acetobacteraceae]|uniref:hypothetical protein n=1 Tax=Acetobacteraceae TaxID=433 RepID=UPI00132FF476|nr:hypothetical protein [Komagataeibacter xylinus]